MTKKTAVVTAADVREVFRSNPERMGRLSPEAQKTVAPGARGRLHAEAVKNFNRGRKPHRRYTLGNGKIAAESRAAARAKAAEAGVPVGKRGRLSKEALAVLKG